MDNFLETSPLFTPLFKDEKLSREDCQSLIDLFERNKDFLKKGMVGTEAREETTSRNVEVIGFNHEFELYDYTEKDQYLRDTIVNWVIELNNETYKLNVDEIEDITFGKYSEGHFYIPHYDTFPAVGKRHRKISFSILLNDDFEGGKLHFPGFGKEKDGSDKIPMLEAGQLCIFPSWLLHEVQPVTKGVRYAIFGWLEGPRIK